jgi:hypothetical protein
MNLLMFPKMLSSHGEGWDWLMRVHPSVVKTFLLYVVPMSLIPPAMLLFANQAYGEEMLGNMSMREAWILAALFYIAELAMVPVMAAAVQRIAAMAKGRPAYHDAFVFAAVAPTPLWLSALFLFIPSLAINALAMAVALMLSGVLIYEGTYRMFELEDDSQLLLLTGSILAAGLVAWAGLMGFAFILWDWANGVQALGSLYAGCATETGVGASSRRMSCGCTPTR